MRQAKACRLIKEAVLKYKEMSAIQESQRDENEETDPGATCVDGPSEPTVVKDVSSSAPSSPDISPIQCDYVTVEDKEDIKTKAVQPLADASTSLLEDEYEWIDDAKSSSSGHCGNGSGKHKHTL